MRIYFMAIMALLMACKGDGVDAPDNITQALKPADCAPIDGVDELLSDTVPEFIIIGETHGTKEVPEFVGALLCQSLAQGLATTLALEISDSEGRIRAYLKSDGGQAARKALFEDEMWQRAFTSGLSSEAMLGLIDTARIWSQKYGLNIITFQDSDVDPADIQIKDPKTGQVTIDHKAYAFAHEKGMAENILNRGGQLNADKTIVLVGNVHARHSNVEFGELNYPAMATYMPYPKTLTLNAVTRGGTSWNCTGPKPKDCGPRQQGATISSQSDIVQNDRFAIILGRDQKTLPDISPYAYSSENYDGVVYVGAVTASAPANKDGRVPHKPKN